MKVTVGMATYQDFDGVYFTLASLKLYQSAHHSIDMLVVDNYGCPLTKEACLGRDGYPGLGARYVFAPEATGTAAPRNLVFEQAEGEVVICVDCHVLLETGLVDRVANFFRDPSHAKDMLQGPLLSSDGRQLATHFEPVWRKRMLGVWAHDPRGRGEEPFPIGMQGLGFFAMRKEAWPGFNRNFRGFGGEEGYIHDKVRAAGGVCWCHPCCRWMHRFGRVNGAPYPMKVSDRIANYLIGRHELGLPTSDVIDHFNSMGDGVAVAEGLKRVERTLSPIKGWPKPPALDFQTVLVEGTDAACTP